MSALKKRLVSHNISRFLKENLLVLFFNYNHINTEEWRLIKNQLSSIKRKGYVDALVVKNRIAKSVISRDYHEKGDSRKDTGFNKNNSEIEKLSTLFQGPTFLIGLKSPQECEPVFNIIKKQKKCIFVGGLYQGQLINHLDVKYLLKVEKRAYTDLVSTLQSTLYLTPITTNSVQLYYLLECYKQVYK